MERCSSWARKRINPWKHTTDLRFFTASEFLVYVSTKILKLLLKSHKGNIVLLVMTNRVLELTKNVSLSTTTVHNTTGAFTIRWVLLYNSTIELFSNNGNQSTSRFITGVSSVLGNSYFYTMYLLKIQPGQTVQSYPPYCPSTIRCSPTTYLA